MVLYKFQHKGIFFEIAFPNKLDKKETCILLPGLPEYPRPKEVMEMLAGKGYTVVYPRYKGTFESYGEFLKKSPAEDILELIEKISTSLITDFYLKKEFNIKNKTLTIIASSFGGSVALHLSKFTNKVSKYIIGAPVIDYEEHTKNSQGQDLTNLKRFLIEGFPNIYRFNPKNYDLLLKGKIIPPLWELNPNSKKITIIHAKDDSTVLIKNSEKLKEDYPEINFLPLESGGHLSLEKTLKQALDKNLL